MCKKDNNSFDYQYFYLIINFIFYRYITIYYTYLFVGAIHKDKKCNFLVVTFKFQQFTDAWFYSQFKWGKCIFLWGGKKITYFWINIHQYKFIFVLEDFKSKIWYKGYKRKKSTW